MLRISYAVIGSLVFCCLLSCMLAAPLYALETQAVSLDDDNGYAAKVLDKVLQTWTPPAVRGTYTLLLKVSLDGSGRVKACLPIRRSSLDAFDQVACSAVRKQAPYGKTSYEAPLDLYLAFRVTGNEQNVSNERTQADIHRAQVLEKNRLEQEKAKMAADAAEKRAREKALAAANQKGHALPEIHPAPVDAKRALPQERKDLAAKQESAGKEKNKSEPGKPSAEPKKEDKKQKKSDLPSYGEENWDGPKTLPTAKTSPHSARVQKYTDLLERYLTRTVHLPKKVPEGRYSMQVQVGVEASGKISRASILSSSGNKDVDQATVHSILVSRTVPAPPRGIGPTFAVPITVNKTQ